MKAPPWSGGGGGEAGPAHTRLTLLLISRERVAGVSSHGLWACTWLRIAVDVAQHKTVNLLKTQVFFGCCFLVFNNWIGEFLNVGFVGHT